MGLEQWFYTLPLRLRSLLRRQRVEEELDQLRYTAAKWCVPESLLP